MALGFVGRLAVNDGVIFVFLKDRWRDLPAEIAVDARVVDKEIARGVLRIRALRIGHTLIVEEIRG